MQFFTIYFAYSFLILHINGQFELDTNSDNERVPKVRFKAAPAPVQDTLFKTFRGKTIFLIDPDFPGPKRFRRSVAAATAHKTDHSRKGHASHRHEYNNEHNHTHVNKSEEKQEDKQAHITHTHAKETTTASDYNKDKAKDAGVTSATAALPDKNKTHVAQEEHNHEAAIAKQDEEKDANEDYDGDFSADIIEPPSSPDITQLSETCLQVKWTSGSPRDRGVKGYKVEYLKGNLSHIVGGRHNWHVAAKKAKPKFRVLRVDGLEPEAMYRFRIATIYAGNKYIYGLSSGWVKLQRYS
ncbi:unnamed protein product [Bemisia tabaci]|uniref:Fibronectin type-III domain-containing protein n=1 Tax=Bemisia tabaci TaxID=7038 RepID=A0A9P0EZZ9_BEMTA|nr:unnamed protein product [Bemisia tabaci]